MSEKGGPELTALLVGVQGGRACPSWVLQLVDSRQHQFPGETREKSFAGLAGSSL